jgi:hypothetical protein
MLVIPPLPKPIWVGYFFAWSHQYGQNLNAPCNCQVVVDEPRCAVTTCKPTLIGIPCIETMAETPERWASVPAIYVAAEAAADPVEMIKRKRDMARQMMRTLGVPERPFLAYTGAVPRWELADGMTWMAIQLYVSGSQGPADLRALAATLKPAKAQQQVALICQAYDRNASYVGDLEALQVVYADIARDWMADTKVRALLWFSDGRPGGTRDHEAIRAWHSATVRAAITPTI